MGARRNLAAFLDEVHAFEPVEGELTLRAFLDYVDAVERLDKQEWAPVQPSDDDSVKVMTIHVAKGLEFDHVFVPGFAHELLPNPKVQQNPAERGKSLDFELRGDADILPRYDGQPVGVQRRAEGAGDHRGTPHRLRRAHPRAQDARCQRRALVRRQHLREEGEPVPERADGLGRRQRPRGGRGRRDRAGEENPMLGLRERFVRDWPGPALPTAADPLFPAGWRPAALEPAGQTGLIELLEPAARASFEALAADRVQLATHLREREAAEGLRTVDGDRIPRTLSASSLDGLRALPEAVLLDARAAAAPVQRTGGAHRHRDPPVDRAPRLGPGSPARRPTTPSTSPRRSSPASPGRSSACGRRSSRPGSPTGRRCSPSARSCCGSAGFAVSGRIDAIYGEPDGPWEIVDWKTGVGAADPLQLELYGLACVEIWHKAPEDLTLTYFYLASDEEVSQPMGDPDAVRERVQASLSAIGAGVFDPTPGRWCGYCDFQAFCDDRARLARGQRLARSGVEPLELLLERPVAGRGVEAALASPGTNRAARPDSAVARVFATARNHSRLPGWITTSPEVPRRRRDASSTDTADAAERVGERPRARCVVGRGHVTSAPSHSAVATVVFCSSSGS